MSILPHQSKNIHKKLHVYLPNMKSLLISFIGNMRIFGLMPIFLRFLEGTALMNV